MGFTHIKDGNCFTQFTDSNVNLIQKHRHTQNVWPNVWALFGISQWLYLRNVLYTAITLISLLASYDEYHTKAKDWNTRFVFGPKVTQYRFLEQMDLRKYLTPECFSCVNHPRPYSDVKVKGGMDTENSKFLMWRAGAKWEKMGRNSAHSYEKTNIVVNQTTHQPTNHLPTTNQSTSHLPTNHQPTNQPSTNH